MRSLSTKLAGSLLLIVLICVGLMILLTSFLNTREFEQFVLRGNQMYTQSIAENLGDYYEERSNWEGVQQLIENISLSNASRVLVSNSSNIIVADSENKLLGESITGTGLGSGTAITASGLQVGSLYLVSASSPGTGQGHGMGSPMQQAMPVISVIDEDFLNRINKSIWQMGLIAALVAFGVGVLLTRQITRPIKALNSGAIRLADGQLDYRVKVKTNDEIGQLATSFNSLADSLEKGEKARRQMTADIAHELKTPLTVIEGTVDGILDGVFEASPEHLNSIKDQTAMLTRLIKDLRDLSLAESGQLKLNLEPLDFAALLRSVVSQYQIKAVEKKINLVIDEQGSMPEIEADRLRIEQVIANLLTNAIRHTPESGQILLSVKFEGQDILTSIADTGEGIDAGDLPHIFERFYRAGDSRARCEGGTGLGLSIVKQMIEAHGGRVWAESHTGKGTVFSFSLPAGYANTRK
ncbi:MAG: ATP-binding protein [Dehalococcoidales bacterium]|nr:ATP-binding protein [Dehalococcoidales bacterium]